MTKVKTEQNQFRNYATDTNKAIAYAPGSGRSFNYLQAGMVEELCELDELVVGSRAPFTSNLEEVIFETGDVFWYIAQTYEHLCGGVPELEDSIEVSPYGSLHTAQHSLRMALHSVGKICRQNAKSIRDDEGKGLSDERRLVVMRHLENVYYHMLRFVHYSGIADSASEVFEKNLEKLFDRRDRGVLQGEGDYR